MIGQPASPGPLAQGWAWFCDYLYAGFWQLRYLFGGNADRFRDGALAPVLVLPGVYETWRFMMPVIRRLHAAGHPVHVVTALGRNRMAVAEGATLVAQYLVEGDLRNVIVVAHSKGGLIGKHLMMLDDSEGRVDRLVAIATPFAGSKYARLLPGRTIRAFLPTDAVLVTLAANLEINSRITSIFGVFDPHIPEGSVLDGASNVELPVLGHFRILSDERVLAAVDRAVSTS